MEIYILKIDLICLNSNERPKKPDSYHKYCCDLSGFLNEL